MCLPDSGSSSTQGLVLHQPVLEQFRQQLLAASEAAKSGEGLARGSATSGSTTTAATADAANTAHAAAEARVLMAGDVMTG